MCSRNRKFKISCCELHSNVANFIILSMVDGSLNTFVFKGHGSNSQPFMGMLGCLKINLFTN